MRLVALRSSFDWRRASLTPIERGCYDAAARNAVRYTQHALHSRAKVSETPRPAGATDPPIRGGDEGSGRQDGAEEE